MTLPLDLTRMLPEAHFRWNQVLEWNSSISLDFGFQLDVSNGCAPGQVGGTPKAVELDLKVGSQLGTFELEAAAEVISFPTAGWLEAISEPCEVVSR